MPTPRSEARPTTVLGEVKRQPLSDEEVFSEIAERPNYPGYEVALTSRRL